jgi:hypothetical protein
MRPKPPHILNRFSPPTLENRILGHIFLGTVLGRVLYWHPARSNLTRKSGSQTTTPCFAQSSCSLRLAGWATSCTYDPHIAAYLPSLTLGVQFCPWALAEWTGLYRVLVFSLKPYRLRRSFGSAAVDLIVKENFQLVLMDIQNAWYGRF